MASTGEPAGQVDDHLELALVVERQHFQHDQLDDGERHRREDRDHDPDTEQLAAPTSALDIDERRQQARESRRQHAVEPARVLRRVSMLRREPEREPRRDDERDGERDQHAHARVDRDRTHVRAHEPGHERHGQQGRNHGERGENRRSAHFVDRPRNQVDKGCRRLECSVPVDVLDDDDRVVDQDADREDQREEAHPVEREAPRPRREQRCGKRQQHRDADDDRLAAAERDEHQGDDGQGREQQLGDQKLRLVVGSAAIVARHARLDAGRNHRVPELCEALLDALRHHHGVFAGLLRHLDRDGGPGASRIGRLPAARLADAVPGVVRRRWRAVFDARDVGEVDRLPVVHPDDKLAHRPRRLEKLAGFDVDRLVAANQRAGRQGRICRAQRALQIGGGKAIGVHPLGVEQHLHDATGTADRRHFARSRHALELDLDCVRYPLQVVRAPRRIFRPQRQGDDRDVVDPLRPHQRLAHVELGRQPVLVRQDRFVQTDDRLGARHADLVLDGDHRLPGAGDRPHVLEPENLREHLLGGNRDERLDVLRRRPRKRNEDVGHRDVDLRFLLARCHDDGEHARHQQHDRDEGCQLRRQEEPGDPAREAERRWVGHAAPVTSSAWRCRARSSRTSRRTAPTCPSSSCG